MAMLRLGEFLTFDDVLLEPQYSEIRSRADVSLETYINTIQLGIPIIASPMDTVYSTKMVEALQHTLGGLVVTHRFMDTRRQLEEVETNGSAASVGVLASDQSRIEAVAELANIIFVDVASGDNIAALETVEFIANKYPHVTIISGSIATVDAARRNLDVGAKALRVGIGNGSFCTTRLTAGTGIPQLSAIFNIARSVDASIIADGGIRNAADVSKAIAAGADAVMLGGMLVGCTESPSELVQVDGEYYKMGRGMASAAAQADMGKQTIYIEGIESKVPYSGDVKHLVNELTNGLKSAMSYAGAATIKEFQDKAVFIRMTNNGLAESKPHIQNLV